VVIVEMADLSKWTEVVAVGRGPTLQIHQVEELGSSTTPLTTEHLDHLVALKQAEIVTAEEEDLVALSLSGGTKILP
jgi:hypothetical protein